MNSRVMSGSFRTGLTHDTFSKWSRHPVNVALYNARHEGRRSILEKFERDLAVTDPDDRPIILSLLKRLVFKD
jgi:hypothetical protein